MLCRFNFVLLALFALSCGMQTTGTTEEEKTKIQDPKVQSPQVNTQTGDAGEQVSEDAATSVDASSGSQDASSGLADASLPADASNTGPNCPTPCNDGNPCTDDICDSVRGCIYSPNTASCDDGNPCTVNDRCNLGVCQGGGNNTCDDSNSCTADSCVEGVGCQHSATNEGNSCGTYGKVCTTGVCTCPTGAVENCLDGIDNNCDGKIDCADPMCQYKSCDDKSKCTENDICVDGTCQGSQIVCDYEAFKVWIFSHQFQSGERTYQKMAACSYIPGTCNPTSGCDFTPKPDAINCHTASTDIEDQCTATSYCSLSDPIYPVVFPYPLYQCFASSYVENGLVLPDGSKCYNGVSTGIQGKPCYGSNTSNSVCFDGSVCGKVFSWRCD